MSDRRLVAAIAACAGLIGCSFLPWLGVSYVSDFGGSGTVSIRGIDVHGLTTFGDGQVVAFGAAVAIAVAIFAGANADLRRVCGFVLAVSGLLAFGIGAYDLVIGDRRFDLPHGFGSYLSGDISRMYGLWFILPLSAALAWIGVVFALGKGDEPVELQLVKGATRRPIDPITHAALIPLAAASAMLAVLAFVPWFTFGSFDVSGANAEVATGAGDGYLIAVLSVISLVTAAWMLRTKTIIMGMLPLVVAAAAGALVIAGINLTADSDVCGRDTVLGFMNTVECGRRSSAEGSATAYLWLTTVLAVFVTFAALTVLAIQLSGPKDRGKWSGEWA